MQHNGKWSEWMGRFVWMLMHEKQQKHIKLRENQTSLCHDLIWRATATDYRINTTISPNAVIQCKAWLCCSVSVCKICSTKTNEYYNTKLYNVVNYIRKISQFLLHSCIAHCPCSAIDQSVDESIIAEEVLSWCIYQSLEFYQSLEYDDGVFVKYRGRMVWRFSE